MKVEIIVSGFNKSLENRVNEFIKDKKVIDIKYQAVNMVERGANKIVDRVLIMYEDDEH